MPVAAAFPLGLALALITTPAAVRIAWAIGFLDHPEARKLHTSATALLGGVAVACAALIAWALTCRLHGVASGRQGAMVVAGALLALLLGLIDDRFGMRPSIKLVGQLLAAGLLLGSGALPDLGVPAALAVPVLLVALAALMNAVNFLDNMNGMVGGLAAIALAGFGITSLARGAPGTAAAQLALAGACVGFLPWNFPKSRLFLGDAGSLFLGYSLGASAVLALGAAPPGWGRLGPPLVLAYPAFDLIFVVVNRLREGRKVYEGGKDHSNHRIARVIQCPIRTVLMLWVSGAALCASGVAVLWLDRPLPALLLWGLWTILLVWLGLRLSSVPSRAREPGLL
jgi:UDP-GlcNAc:undecaprenyl-phosphate/decaprenyl-phosphate GlcNAc-1-phosphate transferase